MGWPLVTLNGGNTVSPTVTALDVIAGGAPLAFQWKGHNSTTPSVHRRASRLESSRMVPVLSKGQRGKMDLPHEFFQIH